MAENTPTAIPRHDAPATPRVAAAVGAATTSAGSGRSLVKAMEAAMSQAVLDCAAADPPITDPVEVRKAMLAARDRVKAGATSDESA